MTILPRYFLLSKSVSTTPRKAAPRPCPFRVGGLPAERLRRHTRLPFIDGYALCELLRRDPETHDVGIVPHFTGPIATAALVNCLSTFSGPVLMEYNYGGRPIDYLPECLDFKNGKAYTNQRAGLGVTADMKLLTMIGEVHEPGRRNVYKRPDGSLTHW